MLFSLCTSLVNLFSLQFAIEGRGRGFLIRSCTDIKRPYRRHVYSTGIRNSHTSSKSVRITLCSNELGMKRNYGRGERSTAFPYR